MPSFDATTHIKESSRVLLETFDDSDYAIDSGFRDILFASTLASSLRPASAATTKDAVSFAKLSDKSSAYSCDFRERRKSPKLVKSHGCRGHYMILQYSVKTFQQTTSIVDGLLFETEPSSWIDNFAAPQSWNIIATGGPNEHLVLQFIFYVSGPVLNLSRDVFKAYRSCKNMRNIIPRQY